MDSKQSGKYRFVKIKSSPIVDKIPNAEYNFSIGILI